MKDLMNNLSEESNRVKNEKGANFYASTLSNLLDFFSLGGALRSKSEKEIIDLFEKAFAEDKELALKCLFYFRDIREGQGERRVFRVILKHFAENRSHTYLEDNLELVPFYGRWDDLYAVFDTRLEKKAALIMKRQFNEDMERGYPSLLGKWLKSENASSDETKRLARKTMEHFGLSPRNYRKSLSMLRNKIDVVERKMSAGLWDEIDYSKVPSKAMFNYHEAFRKHDPEGFEKYMEQVKFGETKMNAKDLYPYEIVKRAFEDRGNEEYLNNAWDNLPQYDCTEENALAVVDTSGSMTWTGGSVKPLYVAISLGLYLSEHNSHPALNNKFITFSTEPKLAEPKGDSIVDRIKNMSKAHWDGITNLAKVFGLILHTGLANGIPDDEMPKKIYIISDMEFDHITNRLIDSSFFQKIEMLYSEHRYTRPDIVFWNVNSRSGSLPVKKDQNGVVLVSGSSTHTFDMVLNSKNLTPEEFMKSVLEKERYQRINLE